MKVKSVSNWYMQKPSWIESIYLTVAPKLRMLVKNSVFGICKAWKEQKQYKSGDIHHSFKILWPKIVSKVPNFFWGHFPSTALAFELQFTRNFYKPIQTNWKITVIYKARVFTYVHNCSCANNVLPAFQKLFWKRFCCWRTFKSILDLIWKKIITENNYLHHILNCVLWRKSENCLILVIFTLLGKSQSLEYQYFCDLQENM